MSVYCSKPFRREVCYAFERSEITEYVISVERLAGLKTLKVIYSNLKLFRKVYPIQTIVMYMNAEWS